MTEDSNRLIYHRDVTTLIEDSNRLIYNSAKPTPLLANTHRFVDEMCEEAYQKCVEYEQGPGGGDGDVTPDLARMLGYLITEAINDKGQRYISKQILDYSKVDGGFGKLARIYAKHVVGRFIYKEKVGSLMSYFDACCEKDPDYRACNILERLESQNYRCPLTKVTDGHHLILQRRAKDNKDVNFVEEGFGGCLRCVHVAPRFKSHEVTLVVDENPPDGHPVLSLFLLWKNYFFLDIKTLVYGTCTPLYHSILNTIGLECDTGVLFDMMALWLDADTNPETKETEFAFDVALDVAYLSQLERDRYPSRVVLDTMLIPQPRHLKMHASLARVCAWSGVKIYLEKMKAEAEAESLREILEKEKTGWRLAEEGGVEDSDEEENDEPEKRHADEEDENEGTRRGGLGRRRRQMEGDDWRWRVKGQEKEDEEMKETAQLVTQSCADRDGGG
ncbi:hypothetical protein CVT24_001227 [Panaeolus cyanescens]|uniref:HNH nuclease domain-containing protein n=1 Tax=Panaeolus cyanescens TaxID=181874 RepID=A0A409YYU8_9AGAR|nr:hypothetical protein CVT24_001227 [Panaeolus cyanescens]